LDADGQIIVPFMYGSVLITSEGYFIVRDAGDGGGFQGDFQGVYDPSGRVVIPIGTYNIILPSPCGRFVASIGYWFVSGGLGFFNTLSIGVYEADGQIAIPFGKYEDIWVAFADRFIVTNEIGLTGVVDSAGREIIPIGRYHSNIRTLYAQSNAGRPADEAFSVSERQRLGILDRDGQVIIPFGRYDQVREIFDGMAIVERRIGSEWQIAVVDTRKLNR
jgi:hypothetical protein